MIAVRKSEHRCSPPTWKVICRDESRVQAAVWIVWNGGQQLLPGRYSASKIRRVELLPTHGPFAIVTAGPGGAHRPGQ